VLLPCLLLAGPAPRITGKELHAPSAVPSFGPNGTHWPSAIPTPFMHDAGVRRRVEVDCAWDAIKSAIQSQTARTAAEGVLILVKPGALPGGGVVASSAAVLGDCGSADWPRRVTVAPRDGYGTVQITEGGVPGAALSGARITKVRGVCLAGFQARALRLTACVNTAIAWTKLDHWLGIDSYEGNTTGVEIVEVVIPGHRVENEDTTKVFAHNVHGVDNLRFTGCYFAPRYRPVASDHSDTMQFHNGYGAAPVGQIAPMTNVTFTDCAFFASSNAAIQTGVVNGMTFRHTYIAAAAPSLRRHPFPAGYTPFNAAPNSGDCMKPLNGTPGDRDHANFQAHDSIIIGAMIGYDGLFTEVVNSKLSRNIGATLAPGGAGAWTIDTTLEATDPSDEPFNVPVPNDTYLDSIWKTRR
jgi:hypothetical protein